MICAELGDFLFVLYIAFWFVILCISLDHFTAVMLSVGVSYVKNRLRIRLANAWVAGVGAGEKAR